LGSIYREIVERNVDTPHLSLYIHTFSEEVELCSERAADPKVLRALEELFAKIHRTISDDDAVEVFAKYGRKVARLAGIRQPQLRFSPYDYLEVMYVPFKPIDESMFIEL